MQCLLDTNPTFSPSNRAIATLRPRNNVKFGVDEGGKLVGKLGRNHGVKVLALFGKGRD